MSSPVRVIDGRPRGDVMKRSYLGDFQMVDYDRPMSIGSLILAASIHGGDVLKPVTGERLAVVDDQGSEFMFVPRV